MTFCLKQKHRIKKKKSFESFFNKAKKLYTPFVIVYYAPKELKNSRTAFVCSKKVGNAVIRNKCKRMLKEFYRLNQQIFSNDYDYIFIAKHTLKESNLESIAPVTISLLKSKELTHD